MNYRIEHITQYDYSDAVTQCHSIACMGPRETPYQKIINYQLKTSPVSEISAYTDFFGNILRYFNVEQLHKQLVVSSVIKVEIQKPVWSGGLVFISEPWEIVRDQTLSMTNDNIDIRQFTFESQYIKFMEQAREYALVSFTPQRGIFEAMLEMNQRIFKDFKFTPGFTEISTPVTDVFKYRKGVCQDFAHLGITCLRAIGLPARYVSGYIETQPPAGKPKLTGADASHAWLSLYIPSMGWVDFDSTNDMLVSDGHITAAYGRDFYDIVPLKGMVYSSGEQKMKVSVDVSRY